MSAYLVTFFISLLSFYLSYKYEDNKVKKNIFRIIAIIVPCLLAAMRSVNIGTDTSGYQFNFYLYAKNSANLFEMFKWVGTKEYLYLSLTYFSTTIFKSFSSVLFFNQLFTILPIYVALNITKKEKSVVFGMFLYFMIFYNLSFNMARQSIALAFIVLALAYVENKEYKKCILSTIIAILFHNSAMLVIPLYVGMFLLNNKKISKIVYAMVIVLFLISSVLALDFLNYIASNSITRFSYMIDLYRNEIGISKLTLFQWLIVYFIFIFNSNTIKNISNNYLYYRLSIIIMIISSYITTIVLHIDRVFYYLSFPFVFVILSRIPYFAENKKKNYLLFIIGITFLLIWIYTIVIKNYNETMPYTFRTN